MTSRLNHLINILTAAAALTVASTASAQSAGTWMGKLGINQITPQVDSGNVSAPALPNTKTDVKPDTEPTFTLGYMVDDHVSVELDLGLPYTHDLVGAGSIAGTGKIGSAQVLPPTLFGQYRLLAPTSFVRPYVGLGLTYAYFRKETGSGQLTSLLNVGGPNATFRIDNKLAVSFQVGATMLINEHWFADVAVVKTLLKTTAHYSTGQTQAVQLNPLALGFGIGYKF